MPQVEFGVNYYKKTIEVHTRTPSGKEKITKIKEMSLCDNCEDRYITEADASHCFNNKIERLVCQSCRKSMIATTKNNKILIKFDYNEELIKFIKNQPGRKYDATLREWSIPIIGSSLVIKKLRELDFNFSSDLEKLIEERTKQAKELYDLQRAESVNIKTSLPLYPYQRVAAAYMAKAGSCLNAYDVGLGKTLMSIAALELLGVEDALFIVPKSVIWQWKDEINKWLPNKKVVVIDGPASIRYEMYQNEVNGYEYVLMGYETMRNDLGQYPEQWQAIVTDEAHRLANVQTKTRKALKQLFTDHRFALTATPLMNNIQDIYGIIDWVAPDSMGSYYWFMDKFCILDPEYHGVVGYKNVDEIKKRLNLYMIRRKATEVAADLPEKTMIDVPFKLSKQEKTLYDNIREELLYEIKEKELLKVENPLTIQQTVVKLIRLAQLCDSMELLGESKTSTKLDTLKDMLSDMMTNGKKALVFTRFRGMADILLRELDKFKPLKITGQTSSEDRRRIIKAFQTGDQNKILIMTEAGSEGINLQRASLVFNYDLPWSVGKFNQRVGRAHRLGQTQPVFVYNLLAQGTVDMYVKRRLYKKQALSEDLIDGQFNKQIINEMLHYGESD